MAGATKSGSRVEEKREDRSMVLARDVDSLDLDLLRQTKKNLDQESLRNRFNWKRWRGRRLFETIYVPWQFIMDDEFYATMRLSSEERQRLEERKQIYNRNRDQYGRKSTDSRSNRVTNLCVPCVGGCLNRVTVNYPTYDLKCSDYLICSEQCGNPIGAHRHCLQDHLASGGYSRFVHQCDHCQNNIEMKGTFVFGVYETPYTLMAAFRFFMRHIVIMPLLFFYVWNTFLWYHSVLDWKHGDAPWPGSPFTYVGEMYSITDPTFLWTAKTLYDKWYGGLQFYLQMIFLWRVIVKPILKWIWMKIRTSFYRYV